jgi:hypothetical protein
MLWRMAPTLRKVLLSPLMLVGAVIAFYLFVLLAAMVISGPVCLPYTPSVAIVPASTSAAVAGVLGVAAKPGSTLADSGTLTVCSRHASAGQHALSLLTHADIAVWAAVVLLLMSVPLLAARPGLFTDRLALMLRYVGGFLLAGNIVAVIAAALARRTLLDSMLARQGFFPGLSGLVTGSPLAAVVIPSALGMMLAGLSIVIKRGTAMQEDVQGLV